jgi:hypothetical protein
MFQHYIFIAFITPLLKMLASEIHFCTVNNTDRSHEIPALDISSNATHAKHPLIAPYSSATTLKSRFKSESVHQNLASSTENPILSGRRGAGPLRWRV